MSKTGYFYIYRAEPNVYRDVSLSEIVEQLEWCGYRCEAGSLERNLAFIELKRRALHNEIGIDRVVQAAKVLVEELRGNPQAAPERVKDLEDALAALQ